VTATSPSCSHPTCATGRQPATSPGSSSTSSSSSTLQPFYRQHRDDGHGYPAYDPKLLLGVLLYGYCIGVRSSRQLERRCTEDVAFRMLAANQLPTT
jgi:transposase